MSIADLLSVGGNVLVKYSSVVEPTTGKRSREFEHQMPVLFAFLCALVIFPSMAWTATALADAGNGSPSVTRPDDQGDENGGGLGQGSSRGSENGQGRGNDPSLPTTTTSTDTSSTTGPLSSTTTVITIPGTTTTIPTGSTSTPSSPTSPGDTTTTTTIPVTIDFFWPPEVSIPPGSYCTCGAP